MRHTCALITALFIGLGSGAAHSSQTLTGSAVVIDGDTLAIAGRQVRLLGVDAPEAAQVLALSTGGSDFLGRGAALMLRSLVQDAKIRCNLSSAQDQRGVPLATCFSGTVDIGAQMVANGMAMTSPSYPSRYASIEMTAKRNKKGFWRDMLEPPWEFRRRRIEEAKPNSPGGCVFKAVGLNREGDRILFPPWSPWYDRIRMDRGKGERWFCNEADAIAQGWMEPRWLMRSIVSGVYNPSSGR